MNDIPDFSGALEQFPWFLAENGYPIEICWVFREDVWKLSAAEIVIKDKSDSDLALVQKVFADGRERGLIEMHAVAIIRNKVAATIWFPKYAMRKFKAGIAE